MQYVQTSDQIVLIGKYWSLITYFLLIHAFDCATDVHESFDDASSGLMLSSISTIRIPDTF